MNVPLIFELSRPGRAQSVLPELDVPEVKLDPALARQTPLRLCEISEGDLCRHYARLAGRTFGVNDGFYPLGSCTMKYNPKIGEEAAALEGFTGVHPLQDARDAQGCLEALYQAGRALCEITGMDQMSFQPAAGAHGELTGLMVIRAYHAWRGEGARDKVIVPDSAHGTNPASAAMCGCRVVSIPSGEDGCVDLDALRAAVGPDTAALMLTNPNTLGVFDHNILEITRIVHEAGALCYYDGANLNAIMGMARPGDMGFDVVHLNLHKTFATPHGGGGPGSGPVGVKRALAPFLPPHYVVKTPSGYAFESGEHTIGSVKAFYGNFLVVVKALAYIWSLGGPGIREAAQGAVLNANYMMQALRPLCPMATDGPCMHEFVMSLKELKNQTGCGALDVAKGLIDYGMHPPTMYFPLNVSEALMVEPTETESRETLDAAVAAFGELFELARTNPERLKRAPHTAPIGRPDEVAAARSARLCYDFDAPKA